MPDSSGEGCARIEAEDSTLKKLGQNPIDVSAEVASAFAHGQFLEAGTQLHGCDRSGDEIIGTLSASPRRDCCASLLLHQLRDHVGIEDDQSKRLPILVSCRELISLTPELNRVASDVVRPRFPKRCSIRSPRLAPGFSTSLGMLSSHAELNISRASASRLRPCRPARRLRRDLTFSSSRRTSKSAIPLHRNVISSWESQDITCFPLHQVSGSLTKLVTARSVSELL